VSKISAGLLMYRTRGGLVEVLLAHPGGPFFATKDRGAWSIPKGLIGEGEDALEAARREFREETGQVAHGPFIELTPVRQKGGKTVRAWACEGDCDPAAIVSNTFTLEWPPGSGRLGTYPEIDRAGFFALEDARDRLNPAQAPWLDELARRLGAARRR